MRKTHPCFACTCLIWLGILASNAQASADCAVRLVAQFPVTMRASQALVVVQIDGLSAPVVLDSGATFNLLSYDAAAKLHLKWHTLHGDPALSGVGGTGSTLLARAVANLRLGTAHAHDAQFIVASLPISPAAGFIGYDILDNYDIDYDLRGQSIKLVQAGDCGGSPTVSWLRSRPFAVADFAGPDPSPTVVGYVNGVAMRVTFDTGASTTILDLPAALRAGVRLDTAGALPGGGIHGVGGRSVKTWVAPVESVRIADEAVRDTRLRIGELSRPGTDLVLGNDFFFSHHVYLANRQHKVYFTYVGGPPFDPGPD